MANSVFAFPNHVDNTFYNVVLSNGSWENTLPLVNLIDPLLSRVTRSTDVVENNTFFDVDLGVERSIIVTAIPDMNLSVTGEYRISYSLTIAWDGVSVVGVNSASSTTLDVITTSSANIEAGQGFTIAGDDSVYQVVGGAGLGLNQVVWSESLDNVTWIKTNATIAVDAINAPNKTLTADKIQEDLATGLHGVNQNIVITAGNTIAAQVFVKPAGRDYASFDISDLGNTNGIRLNIDFTDNSTSTTLTGAGVIDVTNITVLNDGWVHLELIGRIGVAAPNIKISVLAGDALGSISYTGNASDGIYVWGIDAIQNFENERYVKTTTVPASNSGTITLKRLGSGTGLLQSTIGGEAVTCHVGDFLTAGTTTSEIEPAFPVITPWAEREWLTRNWWIGTVSEEQRETIKFPIIDLRGSISAQYVRIEFFDTANENGFIEIPRLFISKGWQPSINIKYGATQGFKSNSKAERSLGNAEFFEVRDSARRWVVELENLSADETLTNFYEIEQQLDIHGQLFFIFDPDDTTHLARRTMLCRMEELEPIEYPFFKVNNMSFRLKEVIA